MKRKSVTTKKPTIPSVIPSTFLSTGSLFLDLCISYTKTKFGGVPSNRIVEFSGTGMSGKTYICGELCGSALRKGFLVFVDDIERRWDLPRLKTFGFNYRSKGFKYLDPPSRSVEECFSRLFKILEKLKTRNILYILDPLAALYSDKEKESSKMKQARAKALQEGFRRLKDHISNSDRSVSIILSNQLIDFIDLNAGRRPFLGGGKKKQVVPGGNALEHWPSIRVRFRQSYKIPTKFNVEKGILDKEESPVKVSDKYVGGVMIHFEILKNSEDDPYRESQFTIRYGGYGIDNIYDCALWLKTYTTVLDDDEKGDKKWFRFEGERIYTLNKFVNYVEKNDLESNLYTLTADMFADVYKRPKRKDKFRM